MFELKKIFFTKHALQRLVEDSERRIFTTVQEAIANIHGILKNGYVMNDYFSEKNKKLCISRVRGKYYCFIFYEYSNKFIIITGFPASGEHIHAFKRCKDEVLQMRRQDGKNSWA